MLAYLLQLNRYALENELITKEIYKKMEISMIQNTEQNLVKAYTGE